MAERSRFTYEAIFRSYVLEVFLAFVQEGSLLSDSVSSGALIALKSESTRVYCAYLRLMLIYEDEYENVSPPVTTNFSHLEPTNRPPKN